MGITTILVIGMASYLTLVANQNTMVTRSRAWNSALASAEAGVEEALAQLNAGFGTNKYQTSAQANWGYAGGVYGPRTNALTTGSFSVIIEPDLQYPVVYSTGYATVPVSGHVLQRTVKVVAAPTAVFGVAMAARLNIGMNGNNVMVDSYDSASLIYSTNGRYNPFSRKAGGDVCSAGGFVNVANAEIYGHVRTSPYGEATVGPQGRVGDLPIYWNVVGQIQPGWWKKDYNADFPDVTVPFESGNTAEFSKDPKDDVLSLSDGKYYVNGDFTIPNAKVLNIVGNVELYVTGSFDMVGQVSSVLRIQPGASLKLYVGTPSGPPVSVNITTIDNLGVAANFTLLGLPSCTSLKWTGNAGYMGCVYAPQADFYLKGSADPKEPCDYQGACVVRSVTMDGHFNFHYDEDLGRNGLASGYTINSWNEL